MARGASASSGQQQPTDWVTRAADDAIRHARAGRPDGVAADDELITCASGASPSGPIHLGNLREFLTVHFVVEEIRRRGIAVRHLHSWDDYDRFRKVPAGVDPSWAEHIGRPLSAVPDPWECHASWAEHFKEPLREALAALGVEMEEVSQTEQYRAGAYRDQILTAIDRRADIERVMARYRTKAAEPVAADAEVEGAQDLSDSVANDDEATGEDELARFPYKPYCRDCGRDTTTVTSYDDDSTDLAYTCTACGFTGVTNVRDPARGQARLEGRLADALVGRGRRLRARRGRPRHARLVVHRRQGAGEGDLRRPRAVVRRLLLRRRRRDGQDVVVQGRRADGRRRAPGARGADPAVALRPPPAQAGLHDRLRTRGRAALRRVGLPGPQGREPRQARRPGARLRAGSRDHDGRGAADAVRGRAVPDPLVGRRRRRRQRRADQQHDQQRRPRRTTRSTSSSPG